MLADDGKVVAVAGYRIAHNLAWGKFLYVDDLVSDASRRSAGHGRRLMDWLIETAEREGCDELHLDSGVQRFGAHRFYLRYGMDITSHHFRLTLHGKSRDQRP
jgi:GNAT superfamily N-acetyltransferase